MAKAPQRQTKKPAGKRKPDTKAARAVETKPDAWERFTRAVRKVAPPKRKG